MFAPRPVTVPVVPLPVKEPEGEPVTVHEPDAGKPLKATLPVAIVHVGWVTVPVTGAAGAGLTDTIVEAVAVQPLASVTAKV